MEFTVLKEFSSAHEKHAVLGLLVRSSCGHGTFLPCSSMTSQLKKLFNESENVEANEVILFSTSKLVLSKVTTVHSCFPDMYSSTNMLYK